MKKALFVFILIAAAGGILFAQTEPARTTVTGTLGVSAGRIAVNSGTVTYYARELERFVGFIDGLKEGAEVTMEGYVSASYPYAENRAERMFFPEKLTLNGKTYDMGPAYNMGPSAGYPGGRGRMAYGYGGGGQGRGRGMGMGCGYYGDRRGGCW